MIGTERLKKRHVVGDLIRGVGFYLSGVKMLRRHPSLLAISLIPIGATVLLLLGLATAAAWGIGELTNGLLSGPWRYLAQAIILILGLLIGWFMRRLGGFSYVKTAAVGIGVSAFLFGMFEIWFKLPLPKGPLEALFGFA